MLALLPEQLKMFYSVLGENRKNFGKCLESVYFCTPLYLQNLRLANEELCSSID